MLLHKPNILVLRKHSKVPLTHLTPNRVMSDRKYNSKRQCRAQAAKLANGSALLYEQRNCQHPIEPEDGKVKPVWLVVLVVAS